MQIRIPLALALTAALAGCDASNPTGTEPSTGDAHAHAHGATAAGAGSAAEHVLVAEARAGTARFRRLDSALAAGYFQVSPCVAGPEGGMGYHYVLPSLVDGELSPAEPEILVYAPLPGGGVKLAALEYVVAAPAWDAAHPGTAPAINGVAFDDHRAPEAWHGLGFPHYDLHAWVWEHNPSGTFAPFNPRVGCE